MTSAEAKLADEEINTEMSRFGSGMSEAEAERVEQAQSNLEAGRAYGRDDANEDVQTWNQAAVHIDGARRR